MNTVFIKEMRIFIKQIIGLNFMALLLLLFCAFRYGVNSDYSNCSAIVFGVLFGVTIFSVLAYKLFVLPYFKPTLKSN